MYNKPVKDKGNRCYRAEEPARRGSKRRPQRGSVQPYYYEKKKSSKEKKNIVRKRGKAENMRKP